MKKTLSLIVMAIVLVMALAIGTSAKEIVIATGDGDDIAWAEQPLTIESGHVGNALCDTVDSDLSLWAVQICIQYGQDEGGAQKTIDISELFNNPNAYLHCWVYIEDIEEANPGGGNSEIQFFNSLIDGEGAFFVIHSGDDDGLKNGWNELTFKASDARLTSEKFDPSKVMSCRLLQYTYTNKVMLDDLKVVIPEASGSEEPTPATADFTAIAVVCAALAGAALVICKKSK